MATSAGPQPRQGNPQVFNIGHLNIGGAIAEKLPYLEYILETGNYDIFGVTEIKLSETKVKPGIIKIFGYKEKLHVSEYGDVGSRGIAIYIRDEWSKMVSISDLITVQITAQGKENIEMVNVYLKKEKLKIIFLYRPGTDENLFDFVEILEESSRDQRAIIMGDMNINWLEERKQFHIEGVQQLVTEVTRPATGTIIDHIWITRDIINLLNCDQQNRGLLNDYQDDIDVRCGHQPIQLNHLMNPGHGVDPYSNNIVYKESKSMSDHCIIWIALKCLEETDEGEDYDDDGSTRSSEEGTDEEDCDDDGDSRRSSEEGTDEEDCDDDDSTRTSEEEIDEEEDCDDDDSTRSSEEGTDEEEEDDSDDSTASSEEETDEEEESDYGDSMTSSNGTW